MFFEFATAMRILFGAGVVGQVGPAAASMGSRPLVVIGQSTERASPLLDVLQQHNLSPSLFVVRGEPTTDTARAGCRQAFEAGCDFVIAIGGGSALDAGKAIAALVTNEGDPLDYLEVIGRGLPLILPSAPFIAIPTTAGTGAEVTRNAVLLSPEHRVKVSLRSPFMLPRLAVVDPVLTYSMPPEVTASTGLDALTQVMEPYVTPKANPLTDAICREGMQRAARSLRRACDHPHDVIAREDMALASLFGGLALANAKLGAVHGFAGPLGGMYPAPHGAVCARLLPYVMAANVEALQQREPDNPALDRYAEVARILTGKPDARAVDGVAWVQALCRDLAVPPLASHGLIEADIPTLVEKAAVASSMKGNPIKLTAGEMTAILEQAM